MSPPVRVGLVSALLAAVYVGAFVLAGWTPIDLMVPGEQASTAGLVEERFGPDVLIDDQVGYDGQLLWATATEFPALDDASQHVQSPRYRFQRILTPAIASLGGDEHGAAVGLLLLGLLGAGLGAGALADLAQRHERPPWVGFLFVPPVFVSIAFGLSEPLAYGLAFVGMALADRRRWWWSVAALTVACLARETVVLVVLGLAFGLLVAQDRRLRDLVPFVIPVAVTAGWALVLASWYPAVTTDDRLDPFDFLSGGPTGIALALSVLAAGVLGAWLWRDVAAVWAVALAFGASALLYADSLFHYQHIIRIAAPAFALALAGIGSIWWSWRSQLDGTPEPRAEDDRGPAGGARAVSSSAAP